MTTSKNPKAPGSAKKVRNLKPKAGDVKGGSGNRSQAEKRLSDQRNEIRRNWAP